ncbi:uncharacterized protein [Chironomus tepperi]|uniref:uncharacterized protein n=1 Tax=Chironomus tepperi TaxID=113505 RepID=UPI00391F7538
MNSSLRFLNFSPNSSKINTPLAESTAIGSPLAKQYQGNTKRKSISPIANTNATKLRPGVKIDPHVLTDAQSNGIVSRLVKYYDQSNEPEKSRTVYSKFGDFPIVQLKKTELKRPIIRSTSVRIAPPNKTVMNPNLRAAIMRSSSFQLNSGLPKIVPTKMRARDDSHKIITNHEPITDPNYPVSSKSVLDALEKNCRKRINNEELILDRSKKVCAPVMSEVVDSPKEFMPIPQSAKRNREELSPDKNSYPRTVLDSINNQQSKRVKTKNNALLSSLSSSHYELPAVNSTFHNNSRISSNPSSPKVLTSKQKEVEIINEEVNKVKIVDTAVNEPKQQQKEIEQPSKRLQLFNTRPDPNAAINRAKLKAFEDNADEDDDELKIRFVKPKEKVLENYEVINYVEKDKLNKMLKGLSQGIKSPVKDSQEKGKDTIDSKLTTVTTEKKNPVASISFTTSTTSSTVAPISTPASTSNAVISTNPSSILSNLVSEKKDAESSATKTSTIPSLISTSIASSVASSSSSLTSSESTIPKPSIGGFSFGGFNAATTQSEIAKSTPSIISTASSTSIASPKGIQSKPLSPLALFSNPKSDASAVDPSKSLISFTPIKPTETVQPSISLQTSTVTSTASSLPVFGSAGSTGFKFGESAAPKNDNKPLASFGFGNTPAQTEKVEPPKALGGFSFGASSTTAQSTATSSTPSFSFGSNQALPKLPTASPLLPSIQASTTSQTPAIGFQSPTTTTTASASTGMFSFGGNSTAPSTFAGIQSSAPTFGQSTVQTTVAGFGQSPAMGITSSISSNAPSFNKAPETTVASGVGFSFGSTNKSTTSGFSFGSPAPTTTASSTFTGFGQTATTAQSTGIFSSNATTTSAPSFSFNSNTVNTTNTANSAFTGFGSVNPTVPKTEAPSMFSFGQKPQTAPVTTNSGFGFGNTMNTATTALSAQPSQSSAFSFGQSAPTNNTENKPSGIFARLGDKQPENKAFSFGGNNTNNMQQPSSTFGTTNSVLGSTASAPNIFGSSPAAPSTNSGSVFGQTPVLGGNNSTGNLFSSNNQATNSPFGAVSSQNNNTNNNQQSGGNLFAFGGAPSTATNNNNNTNNQQSSGMFNFGGSSSNNNNSNTNQVNPLSSNSIFGGASSNNNPGQNVSASFTFNPSTGNVSNTQQSAQPTSPFGQQSSAPPPYQFGSTAAIGNNVSASFSFSGSASAPVPAQTPQSNAQMFNFGSSGTGAVPGNFNFQGQQTALPPQPSPAGSNLFNIGTGGNQQRRPARVATRRYK